MKLKLELALTSETGPDYNRTQIHHCDVKKELSIDDVTLREFKTKSFAIIAECKSELIEAFDRLVEAEQAKLEKEEREKAQQIV